MRWNFVKRLSGVIQYEIYGVQHSTNTTNSTADDPSKK